MLLTEKQGNLCEGKNSLKMFNYDIPENDRLVVFATSKEEADKMVLEQYRNAFTSDGYDTNGTHISEYDHIAYDIPMTPSIHVCVEW